MPAATSANDGYMPKESFAQLESLVSTPGGVSMLFLLVTTLLLILQMLPALQVHHRSK